jgi:hypothetical protein
MKTPIILLLFMAMVQIPMVCEAANYAIHFKNGVTMITNQYWEEGNQIKCNLLGGIVGFDRDKIKSINETNLDIQRPYSMSENEAEGSEDSREPEPPTPEGESYGTEIKLTTETPPDETQNDTFSESSKTERKPSSPISIVKQNLYLDQRDFIVEEMRASRMKIQEAKDKDDRYQQKEFEKKFVSLTKDYKELFNEVVQANGGKPPTWWDTLWPEDIKL